MKTRRQIKMEETRKKWLNMYYDMTERKMSYKELAIRYGYIDVASVAATFNQSILPYVKSLENKK